MTENPKNNALNPTVKKLGLVSLFADISSEMLYPITPLFLTAVLGSSMTSLGIIEGVAEAVSNILKIYAGVWSDNLGKRKAFIVGGYFLSTVSKSLIGFSRSWPDVLGARALDRTGKGLRTSPRDALIADTVDEAHRGAAFGWHRALDTLGAAIGPLVTISFLSSNPDQFRPLFFWALIPGMFAVLLTLTIKEIENSPHKVQQKMFRLNVQSFQKFPNSFKKYLLAWTVFSLANSSDAFLLLKAKSIGISTVQIVLIYCFFNLVYALSSPYLGELSDRFDRKKILFSGLILFATVYAGFGWATQPWQIWILFSLYGLYMGATEGVGRAVAVNLGLEDFKATTLGVLGTTTGLATIFASAFAGFLWDHINPSAPFYYGAAGALLGAFLLRRVAH